MSENRCETCRWWERFCDEEIGSCHRYPPTFSDRYAKLADAEFGTYSETTYFSASMFPVTIYDDLCGEWTAKEVRE